jgi:MPBQ/MSBQ methyltransferase
MLNTKGNDSTRYVAELFDGMAAEYDNLSDLWYRHTFGFIDAVLSSHFSAQHPSVPLQALDVGCGTGIQSFRLASLGYEVEGIDISSGLIEVALQKAKNHPELRCHFQLADARNIPFAAHSFDVVNCCGPTLSFIPEWQLSLEEIARCTKPGGRLLLEVEGKWAPDLFWEVISAVFFDCFGYGEGLSDALAHFGRPWSKGHEIRYAFKRENGDAVSMPLRTFTSVELKKALKAVGFSVVKRWGLHSVSNFIPSPLLHDAHPSRFVRRLFNLLRSIDLAVSGWPFFRSFGCSILVLCVKE